MVEGEQVLSGAEALLYARIRAIDTDYCRAGRQQKVLAAIRKGLQEASTMKRIEIVMDCAKWVETDISMSQIKEYISSGILENMVAFCTVPDKEQGYSFDGGIDERGEWVWTYDTHIAGQFIRNFLYEGEENK